MAAIDVERLTMRYGPLTAVDELSFTADAGSVTCVIGPNGAGKTSTIEALEGLRRATVGRLAVLGLDPRRDHAALVARVGVMLQEVGIHPAVRVGEIVRHAAALYPRPLDPGDLLERVGLSGLQNRTFRRLSGGEQRRLALALALVGRPEVAFLDEPTTGVDPAGRQVIRDLVGELRADGVAVLLTTHELDEAERLADWVLVVDQGRLRAEGTVDELTRPSKGPGELRFRTEPGLDVVALAAHLATIAPGGPGSAVGSGTTGAPAGADGEVAVNEVQPGKYRVAATPTPALVAAVTAWLADRNLQVTDLGTGGRRLEDVFFDLTTRASDEGDR